MSAAGEQPPPGPGPGLGPASGEEFNPGPETPPREAATVILLRGGRERLEVLLVRRTPKARFMGGVWVFPGGAIEQEDALAASPRPGSSAEAAAELDAEAVRRVAAIRELREEAAILLEGPDLLVKFSRWITPAVVRTRFDTHFYLASLPPEQEPRVDGEECVDLGWFSPADALRAHERGEIVLVFPTIKHLEQLDLFSSEEVALAHAGGLEVEPVMPRVVLEGEVARILLPGEPGY